MAEWGLVSKKGEIVMEKKSIYQAPESIVVDVMIECQGPLVGSDPEIDAGGEDTNDPEYI